MLLAQKPAPPHRFAVHHRRMPSAPAVAVVQPTKTPGLLSLSKPQPAPKRSSPRQRNAAPAPAVSRSPAQPDRGRQKHTSSKAATQSRSTSRSSARGKRAARQPSPPTMMNPTSQAEAAPLSDPFLDDSPSLAQPNRNMGKLAKRRQQSPAKHSNSSNSKRHSTPSMPLAVPQATSDKAQKRKTMPSLAKAQPFPICDDVSEVGDTPVTPTRPKRPAEKRTKSFHPPTLNIGGKAGVPFPSFDDGPRTAPLSSVSTSGASFFGPPTPTPPRGKKGKLHSQTPPRPTRERRHKRVPSEGVFHMSSSSDEEASEQDRADILSLFNRLQPGNSRDDMSLPVSASAPPAPGVTAADLKKFRKFAGSGFQSSPSPDELPDPTRV